MQSPVSNKEKVVLFSSCLMLVVGLFSIDLYNPSLPYIVTELNISQAIAKALVVAYLLGFSISQLIYGPLSDKYGRKPIIIISLLLTALGNILTTFADSGTQLLAYRLLTGIGAGGCPVISRAILTDYFTEKSTLTRAFAVFSMSSQLSPAFAPMIGGVIQEFFMWRMNFVALFLVTLAALIILLIKLPETSRKMSDHNMKSMIKSYGILLKDVKFMFYSIMSALVFSYTIGYYTINPFIFSETFHFSAAANGLVYIFYAASIVLGSYLTKRLTRKYASEDIAIYGLLLLLLSSVLMIIINFLMVSAASVIISTSIVALLCGIIAPILIALSVHTFSNIAGAASALQGAIKMAGTGITLAFFLKFKIRNGLELSYVFLLISLMLCLFLGAMQILAKNIKHDENYLR